MINIAHPKINTKPPINKSAHERSHRSGDQTLMRVASKEFEINDNNNNNGKVNTPKSKFTLTKDAKTKVEGGRTGVECEKSAIDVETFSFQQLCNMIDDLEKNANKEIPRFTDGDAHLCYDAYDPPLFQGRYTNQLQPEKDCSNDPHGMPGSTYDEIISFLETLEDGCITNIEASNSCIKSATATQDVLTSNQCSSCLNYCRGNSLCTFPDTFKEDFLTARLHLEEKEATITILKEQLKTERKAACEKLETLKKKHMTKTEVQDDKYQGIIKRHQKFIEQLISEKTDLTEKCNSLAQRIKEMEIKAQKDMKVVADRHMVELQRAKEHCAASEKIRRERWLEAKTSKIKEMTVKGLEPELRNMMEQHQQEIQELRSTHIKELQDSELRIIRRSNQQLEQLRLELTASHEKMLASEKDLLWNRYKERIHDQEQQFEEQQKKVKENYEREISNLNEMKSKRDAERDIFMQQASVQFQKDTEALKQQHQIEKQSLRDTLQADWETWLENYKRQQILKLEKAESKIKQDCLKERDKQIELAIRRLEKETREMKVKLQESFNSDQRILREKYEIELQTANNNGNMYKNKLLTTTDTLEKIEIQLKGTEHKLQECTTNMNNMTEVIKKLTLEKDDAKKFARQEIEAEKRGLEDKIASLYQEVTQTNANKEALMAQLHSRIKLILTQKVLIIKNLTQNLDEANARCQHLEKLLDQQRKEYILKSL